MVHRRQLLDTLEHLLVRSAGGDEGAFADLYDIMSPLVFGLIRADRADRADLESSDRALAAVFLAVWQNAPRYDPASERAASWILEVARGHLETIDAHEDLVPSPERYAPSPLLQLLDQNIRAWNTRNQSRTSDEQTA